MQVKAAELEDMDFSAPMHKQRKYDKRKKQGLRGTPQKRKFLGHVQNPIEDFAHDAHPKLKKLWSLSHTPAIFSTYDRQYFRDESETDTASETDDNNEVSLPVTLTALYRPEYANLAIPKLKETGRNLYTSIVLADTKESLARVESITQDQSNNPTWHAYRAGRITASRVHDILSMRDTTCPDNMVKSVLGYGGHFTSDHTKWGLDMEKQALAVYQDTINSYHQRLKIHPAGFTISSEMPYLGASPDGIRSCDCHPDILVEIKCPHSYKDIDPNTLLGTPQSCIDVHGNLRQSHRYYSQVQMQMFVLEKCVCDFVIYTMKGMYITCVPIDNEFCKKLTRTTTQFFFNYIMPEILSKTIEKSLPTPKMDLKTMCFCSKPKKGRVIKCGCPDCSIGTYHYVCVGLVRKPRGVAWYCPVCERLSGVQCPKAQM